MTNGLTNSSASTNPPINNQNKTLVANGVYTADSGYTGLGEVTVAVPPTQPSLTQLSASPSTVAQTFTPPQGYDGYDEVSVAAVTSAIDSNIASENIVAGTTILGVSGSATKLNGTTLSVTPSTSAQNFSPVAPANGYTSVAVAGVTSSIDSNIQPENIKQGVSILNVTGSLSEGAGTITNVTATNVTAVEIPTGTKVGLYYSSNSATRGYYIIPLSDKNRLDYLKIRAGYMFYYLGETLETIAAGATGSVARLNTTAGTTQNLPCLFCNSIAEGFIREYAYDNGFISYDSSYGGYVYDLNAQPSQNQYDVYVKNMVRDNAQNFDIKLTFSISQALTSANSGVLFTGCLRERDIRTKYGTSEIEDGERILVAEIGDNGTSLILKIRADSGSTTQTFTTKYAISSFSLNEKYRLLITYSTSIATISIDIQDSQGNRIVPISGGSSITNVSGFSLYILALEYPFIQDCGSFKFYLNDCYLVKGNYYSYFAGNLTF